MSATYHQLNGKKSQGHLQQLLLRVYEQLSIIEGYWAYPSKSLLDQLKGHIDKMEFAALNQQASEAVKSISGEHFKLKKWKKPHNHENGNGSDLDETKDTGNSNCHYFEVLFVDNLYAAEEDDIREKFARIKDNNDNYIYEIVFAKSFQDALIALKFNYNIQSVVIRYGVEFASINNIKQLKPFLYDILKCDYSKLSEDELGLTLGRKIKEFRPEVDLFYVTDKTLDQTDTETLDLFRRIFYRQEDVQEAHLSIRRGITERFEAPFFKALVDYSQRPTGVFHAMPISRGNSVFKSNWIREMGEFYGRNIFLAETSATTGGLDSLLQPTGTLKKAMNLAAEAFGSQYTYFVTNGTSTANKIVLQGLVKPHDIVLVDRDCHKSHHYAMVLSGAYPVYLDSYPLSDYTMYGAVPLEHIKEKLLLLKKEGRLASVKMILLTNCTFDGLVYNVQKVMEEVLAIKPD
ncbi:ornithine decarboxylase, partial [bacterium]|nr:ornithine decarboxylase [bacterium]